MSAKFSTTDYRYPYEYLILVITIVVVLLVIALTAAATVCTSAIFVPWWSSMGYYAAEADIRHCSLKRNRSPHKPHPR